jgi:hypothetical protein
VQFAVDGAEVGAVELAPADVASGEVTELPAVATVDGADAAVELPVEQPARAADVNSVTAATPAMVR